MLDNAGFPKNFLWGAATSGHQVEGGNRNDWSEWEKSESRIRDLELRIRDHRFRNKFPEHILKKRPSPLDVENYISGRASDHYNRFREDFDIAKALAHNAHRFSIEWSRIEPEEGKFDLNGIEHYREVVRTLRERSLEPFVTLWHWPVPLWLNAQGGVVGKNFPAYFSRYAQKIVDAFGSDVQLYATLNEPEIYALNSYLRGIWPPEKRSVISYYSATANLIRAHVAAYQALKSSSKDMQIGIVLNMPWFESGGGMINDALKWGADRVWTFHILNYVNECVDFIGLNHYFHNRIRYGFNRNENKRTSDMGYELYPEAIYHALYGLKKYNKPVYITENGLADMRDENRGWFIRETLQRVRRAMDEGADVRGYFHWSLLDNFEWDKGFWPRFGLVEVDYKTMERRIRPSAFEYKKIIDARMLG